MTARRYPRQSIYSFHSQIVCVVCMCSTNVCVAMANMVVAYSTVVHL